MHSASDSKNSKRHSNRKTAFNAVFFHTLSYGGVEMRESFVYRFGVLSASGIVLNLLGFCYRMFLARTVGSSGMGVYQLVLPFYSVLQSLTLTGLCTAVNALSARESAYGAKRVFKTASRVFLTLFTVVFFLCVTFPDFFSETVLGDARTKTAILLLLPCLLLTGFENLLKNYFYGVQTPRAPITSELTEQIVRFTAVALLLFVFCPLKPGYACALIVLGMVISEVVSVTLLSHFYRKQTAKITRVSTTCRDLIMTAIPVTLSGLALNLLGAANAVLIPRGLISFGLSPAQAVDQYGVLFGMTLPLLTLPLALLGALPAVLIPSLSAQFGCKNLTRARRLAGKALHITGLLAFPMTAILLICGNPAMELFYQQKTTEGVLLPLCLATFFSFYQLSLGAVLNGFGKTRHYAIFSLIAGLIQLGATLLVGEFGIPRSCGETWSPPRYVPPFAFSRQRKPLPSARRSATGCSVLRFQRSWQHCSPVRFSSPCRPIASPALCSLRAGCLRSHICSRCA